MISIDKQTLAMELELRIVNHITQNNAELVKVVKRYHMEEVGMIRDYMMTFLNDLHDARALNYSFHMALRDLQIDVASLFKPVAKEIKTATVRMAG